MLLVHIFEIMAVIGVIMWIVNTYVPMSELVQKIVNTAVTVAFVLWLIHVLFGSLTNFGNIRVGPY